MTLENRVKFDSKGLVAAIVQDDATGTVLMLGYMNAESLRRTLRDKRACFWSRSRQELWLKGATSGNYLNVKSIRLDCDGDALLLTCEADGPTCHTGETSCFYRIADDKGRLSLAGDGAATTIENH